jgi:hypothetical protein
MKPLMENQTPKNRKEESEASGVILNDARSKLKVNGTGDLGK